MVENHPEYDGEKKSVHSFFIIYVMVGFYIAMPEILLFIRNSKIIIQDSTNMIYRGKPIEQLCIGSKRYLLFVCKANTDRGRFITLYNFVHFPIWLRTGLFLLQVISYDSFLLILLKVISATVETLKN